MEIKKNDVCEFIKAMERRGIDIETIIMVADGLRNVATDNGFDREGFFDELLDMLETN